jgi:hypothetical protein
MQHVNIVCTCVPYSACSIVAIMHAVVITALSQAAVCSAQACAKVLHWSGTDVLYDCCGLVYCHTVEMHSSNT